MIRVSSIAVLEVDSAQSNGTHVQVDYGARVIWLSLRGSIALQAVFFKIAMLLNPLHLAKYVSYPSVVRGIDARHVPASKCRGHKHNRYDEVNPELAM